MKLESQVTSLELSKRLKELGVKKESIFKWRLAGNTGWQVENHYGSMPDKQFSAFTVAELGDMLPKKIEQVRKHGTSRTGFWLDISFDETSGKWRYSYANHKSNECIEMIFEETEANARAKLLIYLIENNLILVGEK